MRATQSETESLVFPGTPRTLTVIMEWEPYRLKSIVVEIEIYRRIHGAEIGPHFMAHLTENGDRVLGFLLEKLPHGTRAATVKDLPACQEVLGRLHRRGILLGLADADAGGVTRRDFQITPSGQAYIVRFQRARLSRDARACDREMEVLENRLRHLRPSDDENFVISEAALKAFEVIGQRDDGLLADVWDEILLTGTTTVTSLDHRWMLYRLRAENGAANNFPPE